MPSQNAVNWSPTQYDTIVGAAGGGISSVSPGTSAQIFTSNGASSNPSYQAVPSLALSVNIQSFTSSGTYTPTSGMRWCEIEIWGGGASGGVAVVTNVSVGACIGGAGGGGGYSRGIFYNTTIGSSKSVTIGAAGSASAGGNSSVGSLITANGGGRGVTATDYTTTGITASIAGGSSSGGQLNFSGGAGPVGVVAAAGKFETNGMVLGGPGGEGIYGGAAKGSIILSPSSSGAGSAAVNYGGGGSGGRGINSPGTQPGGVGSAGLVTITEWIFS